MIKFKFPLTCFAFVKGFFKIYVRECELLFTWIRKLNSSFILCLLTIKVIDILIWLPLTTISGGCVISITDEFHYVHVFADSEGFKLGYHWCLWIKLNNDLIREQKMKRQRQNSNLFFLMLH